LAPCFDARFDSALLVSEDPQLSAWQDRRLPV
jgi:hypothetical protein